MHTQVAWLKTYDTFVVVVVAVVENVDSFVQ